MHEPTQPNLADDSDAEQVPGRHRLHPLLRSGKSASSLDGSAKMSSSIPKIPVHRAQAGRRAAARGAARGQEGAHLLLQRPPEGRWQRHRRLRQVHRRRRRGHAPPHAPRLLLHRQGRRTVMQLHPEKLHCDIVYRPQDFVTCFLSSSLWLVGRTTAAF